MEQLLRRRQVENLVGLGASYLYELMAAGKFPRPIKIAPKCVRWKASDIEAWILERIAESEGSERREAL